MFNSLTLGAKKDKLITLGVDSWINKHWWNLHLVLFSGGVSGVQLISIRKDKFSPTIEYDICIPGTHLHDMD